MDCCLNNPLTPIAVADSRTDRYGLFATVYGVNHVTVSLCEESASELAGASHLGFVGIEFLVQQDEFPHPPARRQGFVDMHYRLRDQLVDFRLLREINKSGIGDTVLLRPAPRVLEIYADQRGYVVHLFVTHRHYITDIRAEFQPPLDELGRERFATGKLDHVLQAVQIDEMPIVINVACIAGVKPARTLFINRKGFGSFLRILVVAVEDVGAAQPDFTAIRDFCLKARRRYPDTGEFNVVRIVLGTYRRRLGRGENLAQVEAKRTEIAQHVRA